MFVTLHGEDGENGRLAIPMKHIVSISGPHLDDTSFMKAGIDDSWYVEVYDSNGNRHKLIQSSRDMAVEVFMGLYNAIRNMP